MYRKIGYRYYDKLKKTHVFEIIREISDEEWQEIKKNVSNISSYNLIDVQYNMMLKNLDDFLMLIGSEINDGYIDINRLFINFLSMFVIYLNHISFSLKQKYGKELKKTEDFDKLRRQAFDNDFSYAFLYRLRNYSQHCTMPITGIQTQIIDTNPDKKKQLIYINRDSLLENFDWGPVTDRLQKQPEKIDVCSICISFKKCILKFHYDLMMLELPEVHNSLFFLLKLSKIENGKLYSPIIAESCNQNEHDIKKYSYRTEIFAPVFKTKELFERFIKYRNSTSYEA